MYLDFYDAIKEVMKGNKITREEWQKNDVYCFMNVSRLSIKYPNTKIQDWIISDGDILGDDWKIVGGENEKI